MSSIVFPPGLNDPGICVSRSQCHPLNILGGELTTRLSGFPLSLQGFFVVALEDHEAGSCRFQCFLGKSVLPKFETLYAFCLVQNTSKHEPNSQNPGLVIYQLCDIGQVP
jgi:hypothetical protein